MIKIDKTKFKTKFRNAIEAGGTGRIHRHGALPERYRVMKPD
jgi:hypothetical protein